MLCLYYCTTTEEITQAGAKKSRKDYEKLTLCLIYDIMQSNRRTLADLLQLKD
jgi:hypothetical protein